jgi:hypothetical protein
MFVTVTRFRRQPAVVYQLPVRGGFLDRVEVGPVHVLHQRSLQRTPLVGLNDDDRHRLEPRFPSRTEPPLPGHQHIATGGRLPCEKRLQDS